MNVAVFYFVCMLLCVVERYKEDCDRALRLVVEFFVFLFLVVQIEINKTMNKIGEINWT